MLDVGTPSLSERASGFGFSVLDPPELARRFTDRRLAFYAYNVVASVLSVVFGEPRGGVFRLTDGLRLGAPYPSLLATAVASTAASILIAVFAWRRCPRGERGSSRTTIGWCCSSWRCSRPTP